MAHSVPLRGRRCESAVAQLLVVRRRMKTLRTKCREEITRRLLPELERRGFRGPDKLIGNTVVHEYLRKTRNQIERLSIQFDKYQRARFILNVQIDPPNGWADYEKEGGTMICGRIAPGGGIGTGAWFRADPPFWMRWLGFTVSTEREAVTQVIERLDSIEDWFQNPRATETVYMFTVPIVPKKK